MTEKHEFARAHGRLRDELAGAPGTDRLRALGARLSALGSAVTAACERAYLELTEELDAA
jgi:hypothetical protein